MISELQKNIIINTIMPFHLVRIGIFGSEAHEENTENILINNKLNYHE